MRDTFLISMILIAFNSKNGKLQGTQMTMESDGLAKLMLSLRMRIRF